MTRRDLARNARLLAVAARKWPYKSISDATTAGTLVDALHDLADALDARIVTHVTRAADLLDDAVRASRDARRAGRPCLLDDVTDHARRLADAARALTRPATPVEVTAATWRGDLAPATYGDAPSLLEVEA